jgi:death-on-curing protein
VSDAGWRWVGEDVVMAVHDAQLSEHGGLVGVRDLGLFRSALARPPNPAAYGQPDAADLAAAYAVGLVRNHGFLDGNKRTAFVVALVFLLDNGIRFTGGDRESVAAMEALAAATLEEAEFARWLRAASLPL